MGRKKKIAVLLIMSLILSLLIVACGNQQEVTQKEETKKEEPQKEEPKQEGPKEKQYPTGPIEFIVGFGAGGGTDTMARAVQPTMQEVLGVPIVVRNMPGASSALAIEHVSKQPADGQTVLYQTDLIRVMPTMAMTDKTYKDFEQIGIGAMGIANFVVSKDSELKTFEDVVELLKSGKAKVGVAGIGDPWHTSAAVVSSVVGGEMEIITYNSGKNAAMAAVRKEVDFSVTGVNEAVDMLRAGQAQSLAVMDNKEFKVKDFGSIPPVTDFVPELKDYVPQGTWWGPAIKAGTPKDIVDKLLDAYNKALADEKFQQFAENKAIVLVTIDDPQDYVRKDTENVSWLLWDIGAGKRSPEEVGISRPKK